MPCAFLAAKASLVRKLIRIPLQLPKQGKQRHHDFRGYVVVLFDVQVLLEDDNAESGGQPTR